MDEHEQNPSEDPDEAEATVLPAREAMAIITQDTFAEEGASSENQQGPSSSVT